MKKIMSSQDAISLIKNGDTVAIGGFIGSGHPEELTIEINECFAQNGIPKNLTLVYAAGQGDGKERGLNHLGHEGLLKRVIGGHWNLVPKIQKLAMDNLIEAYCLPKAPYLNFIEI